MRVILIAFILLALPLNAQSEPSFDCLKAKTDVEHEICHSEELSGFDRQMNKLFKASMQSAIDQKKLQSDQEAWLEKRDLCSDPTLHFSMETCLVDFYKARMDALDPALPLLYHEENDETYDWIVYERRANWSNDMITSLIDVEILKLPELMALVSNQQAFVEEIYQNFMQDEDSDYDLTKILSMEFADNNLISVQSSGSHYSGGAHGSWSGRYFLFDRVNKQEIVFSDLFCVDAIDDVKVVFDKKIMEAVRHENAQINADENAEINVEKGDGNPNTEITIYYWDDLFERIEARPLEDWNTIGLMPNDENKIESLSIAASAYEYSAYVYGGQFAGMKIDIEPFLPFIKPEYRESFVRHPSN